MSALFQNRALGTLHGEDSAASESGTNGSGVPGAGKTQHGGSSSSTAAAGDPPKIDEKAAFLELERLNIAQMERRAQLVREQGEDEHGIKLTVDLEHEPSAPKCRLDFIHDSEQLCITLAKMTNYVFNQSWDISIRMGALGASLGLMDSPAFFLPHFVEFFTITPVMRALLLPYPRVHLAMLTLISIVTSLKLPMNTNTIKEAFLKKFFLHQENLLIGISNFASNGVIQDPTQPFAKDGSEAISPNMGYGLIYRWLNFTHELDFGRSIRSLAVYILGQCVVPPRKSPPTIGSAGEVSTDMAKAFGGGGVSLDEMLSNQEAEKKSQEHVYDAVCECQEATVELSELLTDEIAREDRRLMKNRNPVDRSGPQYSSYLANLLYGLANTVVNHQKAASQSNKIRGAALFQLMKIQNILSQRIQARDLYAAADTVDQKLFLYVRATSTVRSSLQCVINSWLSTGFTSKIALSNEQGGYDLMTYCSKHIIQAFNNKTAMTKVLGSPWERIMMSQGPTPMIVDLFLKICQMESNLIAINRIGGHKSLHNLSRYGDTTEIRQQATMLLTKLAVILSETTEREAASSKQTPGSRQS